MAVLRDLIFWSFKLHKRNEYRGKLANMLTYSSSLRSDSATRWEKTDRTRFTTTASSSWTNRRNTIRLCMCLSSIYWASWRRCAWDPQGHDVEISYIRKRRGRKTDQIVCEKFRKFSEVLQFGGDGGEGCRGSLKFRPFREQSERTFYPAGLKNW